MHNENVSAPPLNTLVGRQTGLLATDALTFTGKAIVGVVNNAGNLIQRLTIDFDAGAITSEPPGTGRIRSRIRRRVRDRHGPTPWSAGHAGGRRLRRRKLTIDSGTGCGLVVQQMLPTQATGHWGLCFQPFFGLNDLVSRPTPLFL